MQMKIKYLVPVLLIVFIFSFAGCKTTAAETTAAAAETTAAAQTTQPTETTTTVEQKKYSVTREQNLSNGYKYTETFTVWEPITTSGTSPVKHPLDSNFTLSNYDPKKDLAIPMRIQIHNTTADFDLENVSTMVWLYSNVAADEEFQAYVAPFKNIDLIANFSDGTSTAEWQMAIGDGWSGKYVRIDAISINHPTVNISWDTIPPDRTGSINCFIVIHDYYTPAYPKGLAKILDSLGIGVNGLNSDSPFITFSGMDTAGIDTAAKQAEITAAETNPLGGLIFYENPNYETDGWRYLEAATSDLKVDRGSSSGMSEKSIQWSGDGVVTGATGTAIGTGISNTQKIVDSVGNERKDYAAKLCYDLAEGGYSDWFLPSKDELNLMYENLHLKGFGSFEPYLYWSSSEFSADGVWYQYFVDGSQKDSIYKTTYMTVRAIRAFN